MTYLTIFKFLWIKILLIKNYIKVLKKSSSMSWFSLFKKVTVIAIKILTSKKVLIHEFVLICALVIFACFCLFIVHTCRSHRHPIDISMRSKVIISTSSYIQTVSHKGRFVAFAWFIFELFERVTLLSEECIQIANALLIHLPWTTVIARVCHCVILASNLLMTACKKKS